MRVLHLSSYDTGGGAARAASRLHKGLRSNGVDSRMLVQNKDSSEDHVYGLGGSVGDIKSQIRRQFDQLPLKRYPDRDPEIFSPAWTPERRATQIAKHDPDVVHLHWVSDGFIRPETIGQIDAPIVWTVHDMWPFTGGCHYSKSCTKYETECGACPHLGSGQKNDLAHSVWQRKREAWDGSDIIVVSPSQWLAEQASESSLFCESQIEVIPNCLDMNLFHPRSRIDGLQHFDLEDEKHYILFGSAYETHRKGGDLLLDALEQLDERSDIVALTFGNTGSYDQDFPLSVQHLGRISEEELRLVYSTADLTVVPSREDNLPNVAVESVASGTPCVAFDVGGLSDIISHGKTGYLAEPFNTSDLANGISWVLDDPERKLQMSEQARVMSGKKFSIDVITSKYMKLYNTLGHRR